MTNGENLNEQFLAEDSATDAPHLYSELVHQLAPYLIAPVIARGDDPKQRDLILRRLQERFQVKVADKLTVEFSLAHDPSVKQVVEYPHFYLQTSSY